MESSFEKSKAVYKSKIPDIERTLDLIRAMMSKAEEGEDFIANYNLSDTVYAKAKVSDKLDSFSRIFFYR
jgi:cell division ATPase FtsA